MPVNTQPVGPAQERNAANSDGGPAFPPTDVLDTCARALDSVRGGWAFNSDDAHHQFQREQARVVIRALRDNPDEGMVEAMIEARWRSPVRDADNVREILRAAINHILGERG